MNYEKLEERVLVWAEEKGIIEKANPKTQWTKTQEEVEELFVALRDNDKAETIDAYGDILVTIIIGAKLSGLKLKDCLESALNVIEKRSGEMVDGIFVKDDKEVFKYRDVEYKHLTEELAMAHIKDVNDGLARGTDGRIDETDRIQHHHNRLTKINNKASGEK